MIDAASPAHTTVRPYSFTDFHGDVYAIMIDDARDALLTDFGKATMRDRYLKTGESYQDMFARVAVANSDEVIWGYQNGHAQRIYDAISQLWFMPATPVLSNSGVDRGLPISCFLNNVNDSMESIADAVTENIWLAAGGGGIGTSWSDVRSQGELIGAGTESVGKTSGIIPFIQWMDAQTLAISQGSLRRGSAAAYLDISHPEIEEFIDMRRHSGGDPRRKAHNIHHGVMVPDAFMEKVMSDDPEQRKWDLVSPKDASVRKTVDARDLFIKLLSVRMEMGEPYIIFSDTVNNNLPEVYERLGLKVTQSNLCSEITLHTGEDYNHKERTAVCCLSSLNMTTSPDWFGNEVFVKDVMSFLDNVIENFIRKSEGRRGYERARYSAMQERSVGLGIMGFHTHLQNNDMAFESTPAKAMNMALWNWLWETAEEANEELAEERGPCLDAERAGLKVRLSNVFSVAPTASISIICGGVSACVEPIPANSYTAKTLSGSWEIRNPALDKLLRTRHDELLALLNNNNKGSLGELLEKQPAFKALLDDSANQDDWLERQWQSITINGGSVQHLPYLTDREKVVFRTAFEIDQRWVIEHAADRTPYICQSQSVNLFLPANVSKNDLYQIHKIAWQKGLKSLYYLRSRSLSRAMATTHVAGEMPQAETATSGSLFEEDLSCAVCQ